MNATTATTATVEASGTEPRVDRLYALLPLVHRLRDAERGLPLKALLRVIAEQVNVVEDDIAQLYDNWFIETAQDWVVPYIGELVGYVPVAEAGLPADRPASERARVLVPRREIAQQIHNRRAKGTLALLEQLALDAAGWPARAVEFYRLLMRNQNVDHLWPHRHRWVDLRDLEALDRIDGPFDSVAHTADLRRIDSHRRVGRYDIPSVGVFVWRLLSLPVTDTPACCVEQAGPQCYTFSVLGQDAPLFVAPQPEADPTHIAGPLNLPAPIRRLEFDRHPGLCYGESLSLLLRTEGWAGAPDGPVPLAQIVPADLSDWHYLPPPDRVAIDPVLGRIAFPPGQLPRKGVRVRYRYGSPARIGGGEYARPALTVAGELKWYRVGEGSAFEFHRIGDALARWRQEQPKAAVVELCSSAVYVEPVALTLADGQSLELRAAPRTRPVLRLIDWQTDLPDALTVTMGAASRIGFDGLLVTGRPLRVQGPADGATRPAVCASRVTIRHCTLVPGWGIDSDCRPRRPAEASLELTMVRAAVRIEHSIVGALRITEDEVRLDPIPLAISDSIVDATADDLQAVGAPGQGIAHARLTVRNCTVFGVVDVHAIEQADNTLFTGCVSVARRQLGCMRFCYVPSGCRTPRRYRCQPDAALADLRRRLGDPARLETASASEQLRLRPQFTSQRYGTPAYAQLGAGCAEELVRGADDASEIGAFHDLYQPQRAANLRTRLAQYTPAGMDVGLIYAT